jgi:shikimate kinase
MNLDEIRLNIDKINEEMLKLFKQRMELSRQVVLYKSENKIPILNKQREQEIIARYSEGDPFTAQFFEYLMQISRNWQTKIRLSKNIILIGMMGSGKTTIGRLLAKKLVLPLIDTDDEIEKEANMSINDIFKKQGEEAFRLLESLKIKEASEKPPAIISTGGGVILNDKNMKILKEKGIIFFLNRSVKAIEADIELKSRPLLQKGVDMVSKIYKERLPLYQKYADYEIKGGKTPEIITAEILDILQSMTDL